MGEYEIFKELSDRMGLREYPQRGRRSFLAETIRPLTEAFGTSLEDLEQAPFFLPESAVPWREGQFATPSGKFELYSEQALSDVYSPVATYTEAGTGNPLYPLRLISPHSRDSMHSQHFAFSNEMPTAMVCPGILKNFGLSDGALTTVSSDRGSLLVRIRCDDRVAADVVIIEQGWWYKSGSVNILRPENWIRNVAWPIQVRVCISMLLLRN